MIKVLLRNDPDRADTVDTSDRLRGGLIKSALFFAAIGLGGLVSAGIYTRFSGPLDVSTTVLGYPVFANFNVERYFAAYFLLVVGMPCISLLVYALGARILRIGQRTPLRLAPPESRHPQQTNARFTGLGITVLAGGAFGYEAAVAVHSRVSAFWLVLFLSTILYVGAVHLIAMLLARRRSTANDDPVAEITALTAPFALGGLYALSRATHVTVLSTGGVDRYPWLPLWLAILATAVVLIYVARQMYGANGIGRSRTALAVVRYLSVPLILLIAIARLPGSLNRMDAFHHGENLSAVALTLDGYLPWRDLISAHGLLEDVFAKMIGMAVIDNSYWGSITSQMLIIVPIYWFFMYLLFSRLFHRNWMALIMAVTGTITALRFMDGNLLFAAHTRMLFVPIALLLFGRLLDRSTWPRAIALSVTVMAQFIATPESAYLIIAIFATLLGFEWLHRPMDGRWWQTFERTKYCALSSAASIVAFGLYLVATDSLSQFLQWFQIFAKDHNLTGGIPIQWGGGQFAFAAITPVVLVLIAFWYGVANVRARRTMPVEDWMMLAAAILVLLYYQKFLGRADGHVFQSWALAIPLFYYELFKALEFLSQQVGRLGRRPPQQRLAALTPFLAAMTAVGVMLGPAAIAQVANSPKQYRMEVAEPEVLHREGYVAPGSSYSALIADTRKVLDVLLRPGETVFDFTNGPAVFHYLLDLPSPSRYYHVSMAIPQAAQTDLIGELEKSKPAVVAYFQNQVGLVAWDGLTNSVRHYDVSRYLLDSYRPVIAFSGYVMMLRNDITPPMKRLQGLQLSSPASFDDLYGVTGACDWGYAPNFFAVRPDKYARRSVPLKGSPTSAPVTLRGWAADSLGAHPATKIVVATDDGTVLASTRPGIARADVASATGVPNLANSGFSLSVTPPRQSSGLHVFALDATGPARRLTPFEGVNIAGTGKPPTAILIGSEVKQVDEKKANGSLDAADRNASAARATLYRLPSDAHDYQWLEITTADRFSDDKWALSQSGDSTRGVLFRTLPRQEKTYRVMLANCAQWRSYDGGTLVLSHQKPERIRAVRLVG